MNSTALLEAVAMGKAVLSPYYGEAADSAMLPWIADLGSAVEYARSPEQLVARLSEVASGRVPIIPAELGRPAVEALEFWAGNADGRASQRVRASIRQEVEGIPAARPAEAA
jgi:hypothetical protein